MAGPKAYPILSAKTFLSIWVEKGSPKIFTQLSKLSSNTTQANKLFNATTTKEGSLKETPNVDTSKCGPSSGDFKDNSDKTLLFSPSF